MLAVGLLAACSGGQPEPTRGSLIDRLSPAELVVEETVLKAGAGLQQALDQSWVQWGEAWQSGPAGSSLTLDLPDVRERRLVLELAAPGEARDLCLTVNGVTPIPDTSGATDRAYLLLPAAQRAGKNLVTFGAPGVALEALRVQHGIAALAPVVAGGEGRRAVFLTPGCAWRVPVTPPRRAVLRFSCALADAGLAAGSDGATLCVAVLQGKSRRVLAAVPLQPGPPGWSEPQQLDLRRYAGRPVTISFEAGPGPAGAPAFDYLALADVRLEGAGTAAPRDPRPNVILVTLDATRADRLGCYGDHLVYTPHLDRLAREGVLFEDLVCSINNTPPSHFSILSSLPPKEHGVYDMVTPLDRRHRTLAHALHDAGYATAAAVSASWLGGHHTGLWPDFDRYWTPLEAQRPGRVTWNLLANWLDSADVPRPFFAWLHLFDPHTPLTPEQPLDHAYYRGNPRDPLEQSMAGVRFPPGQEEYMRSWIGDVTDLAYLLAAYRGEVTSVDALLGELRRLLVRRGLLDDTLIWVTADHGISLDEHGFYFIMAGLYRQQTQVPGLVRLPGRAQAGRLISTPVQSLDIAPTVLGLAGVPPEEGFRGRNLRTLLGGGGAPELGTLIIEHANRQACSVRQGKYKYTEYFLTTYLDEPRAALFDLERDPAERHNLVAELPDVAAELAQAIRAYYQDAPARQSGTAPVDPVLKQQLESLGYVQ